MLIFFCDLFLAEPALLRVLILNVALARVAHVVRFLLALSAKHGATLGTPEAVLFVMLPGFLFERVAEAIPLNDLPGSLEIILRDNREDIFALYTLNHFLIRCDEIFQERLIIRLELVRI